MRHWHACLLTVLAWRLTYPRDSHARVNSFFWPRHVLAIASGSLCGVCSSSSSSAACGAPFHEDAIKGPFRRNEARARTQQRARKDDAVRGKERDQEDAARAVFVTGRKQGSIHRGFVTERRGLLVQERDAEQMRTCSANLHSFHSVVGLPPNDWPLYLRRDICKANIGLFSR